MKLRERTTVLGIVAFALTALAVSVPAATPHRIDSGGQTVTFWNLTGINTISATPLGPRAAPLASRAMAMTHVAMADAVFSIHPTYESYAVRLTRAPQRG